MYPTITDLLRDLFGFDLPLPIQTFGFFVAVAFVTANYFFALELKRKEKDGLLSATTKTITRGKPVKTSEYIFSGLFGFVLGYKLLLIILNYKGFVQNPQQFILSGDGNVLGGIVVAIIAVYLKYKENAAELAKYPQPVKETSYMRPHEHVGNMTIIAAVAGIIGAKIFHNLENMNEFLQDPVDALLSFSGLTMYGGLIVGAFAVIKYAQNNNLKPIHVIDSSAPALMIGYGIGRIGCHVSGDGDWGIVNNNPKPSFLSFLPDWTWKYTYPHNVINEGVRIPGCEGTHCAVLPEAVYPTPLYEAVACILLFFILWSIRKNIKIPGMFFSIYLLMNGVERFLIEQIRVNTLYHIFGTGITQAQIISSVLILLGIAGIVYFYKTQKPASHGSA